MGDEGGAPCDACAGFDPERIVWEDEHWVLNAEAGADGLPLVLTLWTRDHEDAGQIDDDLASEFGRISNRLVRIIEGLPEHRPRPRQPLGRRLGPLPRLVLRPPRGFAQIKGSYAVEWDDILPPVDDAVRRADLHTVATKLANWGGHARA